MLKEKEVNRLSREISVKNITEGVRNGVFRLPYYQRFYVWRKKDILKLLDTTMFGFNIGSVKVINNPLNKDFRNYVGGLEFSATDSKSVIPKYIIDGQQRITTLSSIVLGESIGKLGGIDFGEIYLNYKKMRDDFYNETYDIVELDVDKMRLSETSGLFEFDKKNSTSSWINLSEILNKESSELNLYTTSIFPKQVTTKDKTEFLKVINIVRDKILNFSIHESYTEILVSNKKENETEIEYFNRISKKLYQTTNTQKMNMEIEEVFINKVNASYLDFDVHRELETFYNKTIDYRGLGVSLFKKPYDILVLYTYLLRKGVSKSSQMSAMNVHEFKNEFFEIQNSFFETLDFVIEHMSINDYKDFCDRDNLYYFVYTIHNNKKYNINKSNEQKVQEMLGLTCANYLSGNQTERYYAMAVDAINQGKTTVSKVVNGQYNLATKKKTKVNFKITDINNIINSLKTGSGKNISTRSGNKEIKAIELILRNARPRILGTDVYLDFNRHTKLDYNTDHLYSYAEKKTKGAKHLNGKKYLDEDDLKFERDERNNILNFTYVSVDLNNSKHNLGLDDAMGDIIGYYSKHVMKTTDIDVVKERIISDLTSQLISLEMATALVNGEQIPYDDFIKDRFHTIINHVKKSVENY